MQYHLLAELVFSLRHVQLIMLLDGVQFGELSQGGGKSVLVEFNVVNFGQHHSLQSFLMDFLFEMVLNPFLVPSFNEVYAHVEYERTLRRYRVYG